MKFRGKSLYGNYDKRVKSKRRAEGIQLMESRTQKGGSLNAHMRVQGGKGGEGGSKNRSLGVWELNG